mmetsp:Transcript_35289/g.51855  ORF Transcript_35289/g.51855 Transcript_35289/m.51855 type:complete len:162 (+) Transcript_35289:81-566(+)|eukprot:CAMPEP_0195521626 /NCGR_PEP_ID=MMETSP0794_2-20130614/19070_1 /TAXON_ID=515487 /ORGANISM="Stephanopyxis turris, Strain CCMP 815" /LENGTH=161 /DNA_ID=CAMNT_0040651225 /DNA_START=79 /DNA_END=564 /DNA_ORIENTATION=+
MNAKAILSVAIIASSFCGSAAYPEMEQFIEHQRMINDSSRQSSPDRKIHRQRANRQRSMLAEKERESNRYRQEQISHKRRQTSDSYEEDLRNSQREMGTYMNDNEQEEVARTRDRMADMAETLMNQMEMQAMFDQEQQFRMGLENQPIKRYGLRASAYDGF